MQPFEPKSRQAGLTLVETMVSIAITSVVALGGYQMMTRSQKYLAHKQINESGKTEVTELIATVKKSWDYRLRQSWPGVPSADGFEVLSKTNLPCVKDCPKLKLYLKRTIATSTIIDVVTIQNICIKPKTNTISEAVSGLNFSSKLNTTCSTCPKGELPAVKMEGLDLVTLKMVLQAENRLYPNNLSNLEKINLNGLIGMQACFSQPNLTAPLSIDVRSMFRDQSSSSLQSTQKTQVYPFQNFANIQLE